MIRWLRSLYPGPAWLRLLRVLCLLALLGGALPWPAAPVVQALQALPGWLSLHAALAQSDDDDDDDGSGGGGGGGDDDDDTPAPPPPAPTTPTPPTTLPAPRTSPAPPANTPAALARSLRLGSLWVEKSGSRLVAVRVSLERSGVVVGTVTLNPGTLEPVPYTQRGLSQPRAVPSLVTLKAALTRLGNLSAARITVGQFAVAAAGGPQLPVYWGGRHVAYLTLDPRGQPRPDVAGAKALAASTTKVRR